MKQLVLLAIVATSIIGATTAFATSNLINITAIQSLGASNDVAIPTDIHVATVSFSTCQNFASFGLTPSGPNTPCPAGTPATVIFGVDDCLITDRTDSIPAGEQVTCKLTGECAATAATAPAPPTACPAGSPIVVVGEGTLTVTITGTAAAGFTSNIGGTVNAAGTAVICTPAVPCGFDVTITNPGPVEVQNVGDVKIIAKGPQV